MLHIAHHLAERSAHLRLRRRHLRNRQLVLHRHLPLRRKRWCRPILARGGAHQCAQRRTLGNRACRMRRRCLMRLASATCRIGLLPTPVHRHILCANPPYVLGQASRFPEFFQPHAHFRASGGPHGWVIERRIIPRRRKRRFSGLLRCGHHNRLRRQYGRTVCILLIHGFPSLRHFYPFAHRRFGSSLHPMPCPEGKCTPSAPE